MRTFRNILSSLSMLCGSARFNTLRLLCMFRSAGLSDRQSIGRLIHHFLKWEFPKIRGTLFWGPYNKDPTI